MNRMSSLFVATTLAILPLSAFAQQAATGAKDAPSNSMSSMAPVAGKTATNTAPTSMAPTNTAPTGTMPTSKTANAAQPADPAAKPAVSKSKTEQHSMNTATPHHTKTTVPAKTAEPSKS